MRVWQQSSSVDTTEGSSELIERSGELEMVLESTDTEAERGESELKARKFGKNELSFTIGQKSEFLITDQH